MARILAIDDDPYFLLSLDNFLTLKQYEVITVQNPYKAKEVIRKERFDCLLLDIQMLGVNGFELMEYSRELHPQLPVIFMSGLGASKYEDMLLNIKNTRIVEKPFDPILLAETIEELLNDGSSS